MQQQETSLSQARQVLVRTLDANSIKEAEQQIQKMCHAKPFVVDILKLSMDANVGLQLRQAGMITVSNMVIRHYERVDRIDIAQILSRSNKYPNTGALTQKQQQQSGGGAIKLIKDAIVKVAYNSNDARVLRIVGKVLVTMIDRQQKWMDMVSQLITQYTSNNQSNRESSEWYRYSYTYLCSIIIEHYCRQVTQRHKHNSLLQCMLPQLLGIGIACINSIKEHGQKQGSHSSHGGVMMVIENVLQCIWYGLCAFVPVSMYGYMHQLLLVALYGLQVAGIADAGNLGGGQMMGRCAYIIHLCLSIVTKLYEWHNQQLQTALSQQQPQVQSPMSAQYSSCIIRAIDKLVQSTTVSAHSHAYTNNKQNIHIHNDICQCLYALAHAHTQTKDFIVANGLHILTALMHQHVAKGEGEILEGSYRVLVQQQRHGLTKLLDLLLAQQSARSMGIRQQIVRACMIEWTQQTQRQTQTQAQRQIQRQKQTVGRCDNAQICLYIVAQLHERFDEQQQIVGAMLHALSIKSGGAMVRLCKIRACEVAACMVSSMGHAALSNAIQLIITNMLGILHDRHPQPNHLQQLHAYMTALSQLVRHAADTTATNNQYACIWTCNSSNIRDMMVRVLQQVAVAHKLNAELTTQVLHVLECIPYGVFMHMVQQLTRAVVAGCRQQLASLLEQQQQQDINIKYHGQDEQSDDGSQQQCMHQLYMRILTTITHRLSQQHTHTHAWNTQQDQQMHRQTILCLLYLYNSITHAQFIGIVGNTAIESYINAVNQLVHAIVGTHYYHQGHCRCRQAITQYVSQTQCQQLIGTCLNALHRILQSNQQLISNSIQVWTGNGADTVQDGMDDFVFDGDDTLGMDEQHGQNKVAQIWHSSLSPDLCSLALCTVGNVLNIIRVGIANSNRTFLPAHQSMSGLVQKCFTSALTILIDQHRQYNANQHNHSRQLICLMLYHNMLQQHSINTLYNRMIHVLEQCSQIQPNCDKSKQNTNGTKNNRPIDQAQIQDLLIFYALVIKYPQLVTQNIDQIIQFLTSNEQIWNRYQIIQTTIFTHFINVVVKYYKTNSREVMNYSYVSNLQAKLKQQQQKSQDNLSTMAILQNYSLAKNKKYLHSMFTIDKIIQAG